MNAVADYRERAVFGPARHAADLLAVGPVYELLLPSLDVLRRCGWTVRYERREEAAVEWLREHRSYVTAVKAGREWREVVQRMRQTANCGKVILAARQELPAEEVFRSGVHDALRVPFESYDVLWCMVTARREARAELGECGRFP